MVVYILYSESLDQFYIGQTEDLNKRLDQHLNKLFTDGYTTKADDWSLYFYLECTSRRQAVNIERHIKRMKSRKFINDLKNYPELGERLKLKYH